jgi:ATP-dependent HslUV protease subunit HslV
MAYPVARRFSFSPFSLFEITAAARALLDFPDLSAEEVAKKAMDIASDMCIYTNKEFLIECLDEVEETKEE